MLANEFVKRLVKAWDPDYTKLTPAEEQELKNAMSDEFIPEEKIDWDNLNAII